MNIPANGLDGVQRAVETIQNNVTNSSTPGYASQTLNLQALPFQPSAGLPGGLSAGQVQSARDEYAEQSVRQQFPALGTLEQTSQSLSSVELNFNVSSDSGIPGALNTLLQNFSSWSVTPTDSSARQSVINGAQQLTQAFQQAAAGLTQNSTDTALQLRQSVTQINSLASQLQAYNVQRIHGGANDAGLDAQIHSTRE